MGYMSQSEAAELVELDDNDEMSIFLVGFLSAALWTGFDETDNDAEFLDDNFAIIDIDKKSQLKIAEMIRPFYDNHASKWSDIGYFDDNAGHDLLLTMCGHGTGFWDRDYLKTDNDDIGEKLTTIVNEMFGNYNSVMGYPNSDDTLSLEIV